MNLTQRQLSMFVITADLMNILRASQVLHISQPALSRALQELEAQLGVTLLQRTTRQLSLTTDGQQFLPVAQRLLRAHDPARLTAQHGPGASRIHFKRVALFEFDFH